MLLRPLSDALPSPAQGVVPFGVSLDGVYYSSGQFCYTNASMGSLMPSKGPVNGCAIAPLAFSPSLAAAVLPLTFSPP